MQNWYIQGQARVCFLFKKSNRKGPFLMLAHLAEISFGDNSKERLNTEVPLYIDATAPPPPLPPSWWAQHSRTSGIPQPLGSVMQCSHACSWLSLRMPWYGLPPHAESLASSSIFRHYYKAGWLGEGCKPGQEIPMAPTLLAGAETPRCRTWHALVCGCGPRVPSLPLLHQKLPNPVPRPRALPSQTLSTLTLTSRSLRSTLTKIEKMIFHLQP